MPQAYSVYLTKYQVTIRLPVHVHVDTHSIHSAAEILTTFSFANLGGGGVGVKRLFTYST